MDNFIED